MTATRLLPLNTDYTDKDFDSWRARMVQLISSVFPTWTDTSDANFGNILLSLFAYQLDVLSFYQDKQATESRITTAKLRRSLLGLVKLIGYTPAGASAATVDVTVTLAAPVQAGATLTIARGDRVLTREVTAPIAYQALADVVFDAGEDTKTFSVENSAFASSTLVSTGLANQGIVLPSTPYLDDSATVVFGDGAYTQVDNFLASASADKHFTVTVDQNDRATLRFGNGVNGSIPIGTGTIEYKTGGGKAGRVDAQTLVRLGSQYQDSFGAAVRASVTNALASSGGTDRESNTQIAQNAPESLRVLRRAVAREDYEIAAQQVPGVARALLVTSNEVSGVDENTGYLFIVPVGGGTASSGLLAEVRAQFVGASAPYPKPNTFALIIQSASYLSINVDSTIYVAAGSTPAAAKANALAALEALFAILDEDDAPNPDVNFGYYVQDSDGVPSGTYDWSTIFNAIRDAAGVRKVDAGASGLLLNGQRADVAITTIQFPVLGTVIIRDGATGLAIG